MLLKLDALVRGSNVLKNADPSVSALGRVLDWPASRRREPIVNVRNQFLSASHARTDQIPRAILPAIRRPEKLIVPTVSTVCAGVILKFEVDARFVIALPKCSSISGESGSGITYERDKTFTWVSPDLAIIFAAKSCSYALVAIDWDRGAAYEIGEVATRLTSEWAVQVERRMDRGKPNPCANDAELRQAQRHLSAWEFGANHLSLTKRSTSRFDTPLSIEIRPVLIF